MSVLDFESFNRRRPQEYRPSSAWQSPQNPPPPTRWPVVMGAAVPRLDFFPGAAHADVLLGEIEKQYVFQSRGELGEFLREYPATLTLLSEAANWLDAAFGPGKLKLLRLLQEDSGYSSVFGIVLWPGSVEDGHAALREFDQSWWLANCHRAGGLVNFNIELI